MAPAKPTSSGKLARWLLKSGRTPLLVAADVYRPAAMEQLATLGEKLGLPVFVKRGENGWCFGLLAKRWSLPPHKMRHADLRHGRPLAN
jgi:hypothetical protein